MDGPSKFAAGSPIFSVLVPFSGQINLPQNGGIAIVAKIPSGALHDVQVIDGVVVCCPSLPFIRS